MVSVKNYRELKVWQRSFALANTTFKITENFPQQQRFGLATQMQRSSVSVPSNIAEGFNCRSTKEYLHFLSIALGSLAELKTQTMIASAQGFILEQMADNLLQEMDEIGKMLRVLMQRLQEKSAA